MSILSKIAVIVAILACVGSLYFANRLDTIKKEQRAEIVAVKATLTTTSNKFVATQKTLQETSVALTNTQNDLATANATIQTKTTELAQRQQDIDGLKKQVEEKTAAIETAKTETTTAKNDLQKLQDSLKEVGITEVPAQIKEIKLQLAIASDESKVFGEQLLVMHDQNDQLKAKIVELSTTPVGLRARVVLVNNDWGFVVLNVGKDQHVQPNTSFILYRDSKMIGKALVRNVSQDSCVADLIPEFTQMPPRVGDFVIH